MSDGGTRRAGGNTMSSTPFCYQNAFAQSVVETIVARVARIVFAVVIFAGAISVGVIASLLVFNFDLEIGAGALLLTFTAISAPLGGLAVLHIEWLRRLKKKMGMEYKRFMAYMTYRRKRLLHGLFLYKHTLWHLIVWIIVVGVIVFLLCNIAIDMNVFSIIYGGSIALLSGLFFFIATLESREKRQLHKGFYITYSGILILLVLNLCIVAYFILRANMKSADIQIVILVSGASLIFINALLVSYKAIVVVRFFLFPHIRDRATKQFLKSKLDILSIEYERRKRKMKKRQKHIEDILRKYHIEPRAQFSAQL